MSWDGRFNVGVFAGRENLPEYGDFFLVLQIINDSNELMSQRALTAL